MTVPAWSFSSYKQFVTCPRQYYHVRILKDVPREETEQSLYGKEFHSAAERFIRDGDTIPERFDYAAPLLQRLAEFNGTKLCEKELALTETLTPCDFRAPEAWLRGIIDLIVLDGKRARVVDYKTGGSTRYADMGQLELAALMLFAHYPEVEVVHAGLLFVVAKAFIKDKFTRDMVPDMWLRWLRNYNALNNAYDTNVWNPKESGLCKRNCAVLSCPHNGRS